MSMPNMNDPVDALAHALSEIMNDAAPMGWEKYRGHARCLLGIFDLSAKEGSFLFDKYNKAFPSRH